MFGFGKKTPKEARCRNCYHFMRETGGSGRYLRDRWVCEVKDKSTLIDPDYRCRKGFQRMPNLELWRGLQALIREVAAKREVSPSEVDHV